MKTWTGLVQALLGVWLLASLALFGLGTVNRFLSARVPLPWSNVDDFAFADGRVYVYSGFWERVLVYEAEGRFLGSALLAQGRGWAQIAVDQSEQVWLRKGNTTCVSDRRDPLRWTCREYPLDDGECLVSDGISLARITQGTQSDQTALVCVPWDEASAERTAAGRPWLQFRAAEPPTIVNARRVPCRFSLGVLTCREGQEVVARARSPWFAEWGRFPLPGLVPWVVGLILVVLERRKKRMPQDGLGRVAS